MSTAEPGQAYLTPLQKFIKREKAKRGSWFNQRYIAAFIGVSEFKVCRWARGHQRLPDQYVKPLAQLLRCRPGALRG